MVRFPVRNALVGLHLLALGAAPLLGQTAAAGAALTLRPGDAVRLEVRDEPGLAGDFQVDEAGRVLLPLVGLVPVAGRAFADVRRDVEAGYARELAEPVIRLTPLIRIAVLGEVRAPGLYAVDPTHRVRDVLALAGGRGPAADRDGVSLVRDGQRVEAADTLALRSGDQVVVGRRGWIGENATTLVGAGASLLVAVLTALILR